MACVDELVWCAFADGFMNQGTANIDPAYIPENVNLEYVNTPASWTEVESIKDFLDRSGGVDYEFDQHYDEAMIVISVFRNILPIIVTNQLGAHLHNYFNNAFPFKSHLGHSYFKMSISFCWDNYIHFNLERFSVLFHFIGERLQKTKIIL